MADPISLIRDYENLVQRRDKIEENLKVLVEEHSILDRSRKLLIDFTEDMRNKIKVKLESLANSGLAAVYTDKKMEFLIIANPTKNGLQYDLYISTNGMLTPLKDAKGGGVLDIITLSLRISFVKLFSGQLRQTIILDEPFKNMDIERVENAVTWLSEISKELEIQFIVVTHIPDLIGVADKSFRFELVNDVTKVTESIR